MFSPAVCTADTVPHGLSPHDDLQIPLPSRFGQRFGARIRVDRSHLGELFGEEEEEEEEEGELPPLDIPPGVLEGIPEGFDPNSVQPGDNGQLCVFKTIPLESKCSISWHFDYF